MSGGTDVRGGGFVPGAAEAPGAAETPRGAGMSGGADVSRVADVRGGGLVPGAAGLAAGAETTVAARLAGGSRAAHGADGLVPARRYGLLTSFRNPHHVLALANVVSGPLRAAGLEVDQLRARDDASSGEVRCALLPDVRAELEWLAGAVAQRWRAHVDATGGPPTAAVLVRRRADMAGIAAALRARGLPVEVVGLGGLLDEPEVRDLVSALRVLVDPLAGTAAARLLTGSRWRLAAADLRALWQRARQLVATREGRPEPDDPFAVLADALPGEHAEQAGLVDALDDPGDAAAYSAEGHRRIRQIGAELAALRRRLDQPLPELVADVERTLLLDIEAMARPGSVGRAHLDAFADVVADYAGASPSATLSSLLDYLATAERAEDGLAPGEVEVAEDRVQVLTVHSAKGLEWQVVAVPHLVREVFPGRRRSSCWLRSVPELPADLRGDAEDLPELRLSADWNRKEVDEALATHSDEFEERRLIEERRLFYVALTRSEETVLLSGHWWGETGEKPRGPSEFLVEIRDAMRPEAEGAGAPAPADWAGSAVEHWAEPPGDDERNPFTENARTASWPVDPLGDRRAAVIEGAALVRAELSEVDSPRGDGGAVAGGGERGGLDAADAAGATADQGEFDEADPEGWSRDVDVLLAERAAAANRRERVALPEHLSVSQLVELAADQGALARRLRRPLPFPPSSSARRGTQFHAWLEQRYGASRLLDLDELPGAADADAAPDEQLAVLQQAFLDSEWADRVPYDVEVPFEADVEGISVRGRMDAVFADTDGGWTVVDWKTGAVPGPDHLPALAVQLAAYRLAWAALSGAPLDRVRAAFHYVRHDRTVRPADLLDVDGLRALLRGVPVELPDRDG